MKTNLFTALTCLIMGMSVPSLLAADKAAPKETTVVIARGLGLNAEKALLAALRNAVQQVVGVIIDAETYIKNEKVVKDEILDFSNGFVEKFEKLKEGKNDDGLYEVTVKATVKRRQLIERLQKAKVYSAKVDGASLFGSVVSEMDAQKKGAKLLEKALADLNLPYSLLKAEVVNSKPKILKKFDTEIQAQWSIRVQFDMEKYQKVVLPKLKQVLGDIALEKNEQLILQDPKKVDKYHIVAGLHINPFNRSMKGATFRMPTSNGSKKDSIPVFLLERREEATMQQWYGVYWIDFKSADVLKKYLQAHGKSPLARELHVALIGKDKQSLLTGEIAWALPRYSNRMLIKKGESVFGLAGSKSYYGSWVLRPTLIEADFERAPKIYYIFPFIRVEHGNNFDMHMVEKADYLWQPKVPLQVLKDVVGIEVKIQPFKAQIK